MVEIVFVDEDLTVQERSTMEVARVITDLQRSVRYASKNRLTVMEKDAKI